MSCNLLATQKITVEKPRYVREQCATCSKPVIDFLKSMDVKFTVEEIKNWHILSDSILAAASVRIIRHISRQKKNWRSTCQRFMIAVIRHTVWMILISRMEALFSDALFLLVLSKVLWKYRWVQAALQRKALGGWGIILAQQTSRASSDIEKQRDIFAQWGSCNCPEFCLEEVHPCNGVTITSCQICQKEHARRYDWWIPPIRFFHRKRDSQNQRTVSFSS